jgi:RNA polymerase sigma factor (sigma-70 family)
MSNSNYIKANYNDNFALNYMKYLKVIMKFLKKFVYDWDICEELSHDVFLKVYERNVELDPYSTRTVNYLMTVAKNTAIDYLRRKKIEEEKLQKKYFDELFFNAEFYNDIGDAYIKGEIVSTLSDIVNSFPDYKKDIFIKINFFKKKYAAVTCDTNMSAYKIKQINDEINQRIRDNLKHFFE